MTYVFDPLTKKEYFFVKLATMSNQPTPAKTKSNFNLILGLILGGLGVVLILQNSQPVDFWLWFWKINTSLIILLAITFGSGLLMAWLLSWSRIHQLKKRVKELEKSHSKPQA